MPKLKSCKHLWKSGGMGTKYYENSPKDEFVILFCEKCGEIKKTII